MVYCLVSIRLSVFSYIIYALKPYAFIYTLFLYALQPIMRVFLNFLTSFRIFLQSFSFFIVFAHQFLLTFNSTAAFRVNFYLFLCITGHQYACSDYYTSKKHPRSCGRARPGCGLTKIILMLQTPHKGNLLCGTGLSHGPHF